MIIIYIIHLVLLLLKLKFVKNRDKVFSRIGCVLNKILFAAGPSFIKLGQFLSTRHDLLNKCITEEFVKLQDAIMPLPWHKVSSKIQHLNHISIDTKPVASASVAQVHRGKIHDINLAIKILRPNIRKKFVKNIKFMKKIIFLIEKFFKKSQRLKLNEIIKIIEQNAIIELNLKMEAAVASKMREENNNQDLIIPKIFWEYSNQDVLVMEWIDGIKINEIDANYNNSAIANNLINIFFNQVYINGFFHADIHPGNILITKDNKLAFIDFGIVSFLPDEDKFFLAQMFHALSEKNYDKIAELHFKANYIAKNQSIAMFALACRSAAEPMLNQPLSAIPMSQLLEHLFYITAQFDMETQPHLVSLQQNLVMLEGILYSIAPNINMWDIITPWFKDWAANHLNFKSLLIRRIDLITDLIKKKFD